MIAVDLGIAQDQGAGTTVRTQHPLPGLATDRALAVGCSLPGLLVDQLRQSRIALVQVDEDVVRGEEAELPEVARRGLAIENGSPCSTQVTRVARQPDGRLVGASTGNGASLAGGRQHRLPGHLLHRMVIGQCS